MTIEMYLETTDPMEAFLLGVAQHVADTAKAFDADPSQETYDAWIAAGRLFARHQQNFYGAEEAPDAEYLESLGFSQADAREMAR